jgi:hypothetical protein
VTARRRKPHQVPLKPGRQALSISWLSGWIAWVAAALFVGGWVVARRHVPAQSYFVLQGQPFSDPAGTLFGTLSWQAGLG